MALICKTSILPYPAAAQPELSEDPSLMLSAVQPHHPSLIYPLHQHSKMRQWATLSPASWTTAQPGAELDRVRKSWLKTQMRNLKTSSYKPNSCREFYTRITYTSETWAWRGVCFLWALGQWPPACRMPKPQLGRGSPHAFPKARCPHHLSPRSVSWAGLGFVQSAMVHIAGQLEEHRNAASSKNIHIRYTCLLHFCTYCYVCN